MAGTWVVTGANRGLGLEFVRQLRARGAAVVGTLREGADPAALQALGARAESLDVRSDAECARLAERLGDEAVDVLINNAGRQYRVADLEELDFQEMRDAYDTNALGPFRVLRALLPHLQRGGKKLVVHVTSRMGCFGEYDGPSMPGYRASKAGLNMVHRCIAEQLEPRGVRCVALHPGWVRTDMGGASATLGVEESVAGMLRVLEGLPPDRTGQLLNLSGEPLPW